MPYRKLLDIYRGRLSREKSAPKRQEIELICAILLDIIERQERDAKLIGMMQELESRLLEH